MPRIKLTIKYDGHDFHGWQKQYQQAEPGDPPRWTQAESGATGRAESSEPYPCFPPQLRTAQGVVEHAVRRAVREPVNVIGASRTDAGVHAEGQVAAFTVENLSIPIERLHRAINRYLPYDAAIVKAEFVDDEFCPISDTIGKTYRYTIHYALIRPVFDRYRVFHCWVPLDIEKMNQAAQAIIGEHDFASFANTHHGRESTIREVYSCSIQLREGTANGPDAPVEGYNRIAIDIAGKGFLYHMVRIIVGTLVEIGRGRLSVDDMDRILKERDRRAAGPTLPPEGLCLLHVDY